MLATGLAVWERRETLASELADAALMAVAPQGVRGPSIDLELGLWKALGRTLAKLAEEPRSTEDACEQKVARLTRAAYEVALGEGIQGSFLDMELRLWKAMRTVVGRNRSQRPCVC